MIIGLGNSNENGNTSNQPRRTEDQIDQIIPKNVN